MIIDVQLLTDISVILTEISIWVVKAHYVYLCPQEAALFLLTYWSCFNKLAVGKKGEGYEEAGETEVCPQVTLASH